MQISIGDSLEYIKSITADMEQKEVISRIWQRDYHVWASSPVEISDRLGWLTLTDTMPVQVEFLISFAAQIKNSGFQHVVLLGMGGSSLGAEVLHQTYGSRPGYPELLVLDSTLPASIRTVTEAINPEHTLFIVSSKSGTTTETNVLFSYFESLVLSATGKSEVGDNFIAITDAGTPLVKLAIENKFRHIFITPLDIGGRYSVLSFFGLVPAALMGIDIAIFLKQAARMCSASRQPDFENNTAAKLGAVLGCMALKGRNKLTLITSPRIKSFGLWLEQLIAESTGKDGKGIVPVINEPLMTPSCYGNDRVFVYLRLENDENSAQDIVVKAIKNAVQPVLLIEIKDKMELGAEFFRWEFATAVAATILGVNPFNQPDVEVTKVATEVILKKIEDSRYLTDIEYPLSIAELLSKASSGDYLAVLAYLPNTNQVDKAIETLRRKVVEKYNLATTSGYGPRYLHSTGQLYKGGPAGGIFLLITMKHNKDIEIPGKQYTFGTLVDAQASGDAQILRSRGRRVDTLHLDNDMADLGILADVIL